ncbi:hypothetical protein BCEP4_1120027 [Burkholderia cepacia]|nr:hypothetical protein BCEP4_1120027 [Burkholderia cepacia]
MSRIPNEIHTLLVLDSMLRSRYLTLAGFFLHPFGRPNQIGLASLQQIKINGLSWDVADCSPIPAKPQLHRSIHITKNYYLKSPSFLASSHARSLGIGDFAYNAGSRGA